MLGENKNPYFAKDNRLLSQDQIEEKLLAHIHLISDRPVGRNFDWVDYNTKFTCLHFFRDNEERQNQLLKLLLQYNGHNEESRQIIIHGIVTNGLIQKNNVRRGKKSQPMYALSGIIGAFPEDNDNTLNSFHLVCVNALQWIFFIGRKNGTS